MIIIIKKKGTRGGRGGRGGRGASMGSFTNYSRHGRGGSNIRAASSSTSMSPPPPRGMNMNYFTDRKRKIPKDYFLKGNVVHVPAGYVLDGDYYVPRPDYDEWYDRHVNPANLRLNILISNQQETLDQEEH